MVPNCVNPSVGGFSDAITSLATKTKSALMLSANKESGSYNWMIGIVAMSPSTIPTGTGNHPIDVLDLLGASSLTPSSYSFNATEDYYESTVWLWIMSDSSVSFVSCGPPLKEYPEDLSERGWLYMFPMINYAMFFFGSESSGVEALTFTFKGKVVPEFTPSTIVITLILAAACIIGFKKRMLRKN
jgi:hypothetical protein